MMEGIYFFGEYQRWNLGWNNPNQAGAFVAMLIPWLWGLGRLTGGGSWRANGLSMLWLAIELGLWFLLCKTYSRGALVAVGIAGVIYFLWNRYLLSIKWSVIGWVALRLLGIGVLLVVTGFFARIDPSYVSQDASAGNRLTLWKGGLQMIAASPWRGWGEGKSGSGFMHWFQPLEAREAYAGMVNSYLHVGVEYGLPVLVAVLAAGSALVALSLPQGGLARENAGRVGNAVLARIRICGFGGCVFRRQARRPSVETAGTAFLPFTTPDGRRRKNKELGNSLALAGGASLVVFAVANVFSTLWIFRNLWWLPAVDAAVVMGFGFHVLGGRFVAVAGKTLAVTGAMSLILGILLYGYGRLLAGELRIVLDHQGNVVVNRTNGMRRVRVLVFPERTVLGETWGKEIRRLAADELFRDAEIGVSEEAFLEMGTSPGIIIACGARASDGLRVASRYPESRLMLVHPVGRPDVGEGRRGRVTVLLPGLDTVGSGRIWRRICKQRGWECVVSPGVGQDVRLAWPGLLNLTNGRRGEPTN